MDTADMVRMIESVEAFHERFGISEPAMDSRLELLMEEVAELRYAVQSESIERVANEAADVLYVVLGTFAVLPPQIVRNALRQVIYKNDAKTLETHYVNEATGKVTRRAGTASKT